MQSGQKSTEDLAGEPSLNKETIEPSPNKQAKPQKKIELSIDELMGWERKSKQNAAQIKQLSQENNQLKAELAAFARKAEERRVQDREGLQETINELQKILSETSSTTSKLQKQRDKLYNELAIELTHKASRQKQIDQLRDVSSQYFLLKQQVNRLQGQIVQLRKGRDSVTSLQSQLTKLTDRSFQLQQSLKQSKQQLHSYQSQNLSLVMQRNSLLSKSTELEQQLKQLTDTKNQLEEKVETLELEVKEVEKDRELAMRRMREEMREVRETLGKEVKGKEKLLQQREAWIKEAEEREMERQKQKEKEKDRHNGKSQRFLRTRLEELEMENRALKESMTRVAEEMKGMHDRLKDKDTSIGVLTHQLAKTWPNLEDSEGLEYVEKQIIEIGKKQKLNYGEIIEKVMIENLRLKHSIQTIGSEYNELRRNKNI